MQIKSDSKTLIIMFVYAHNKTGIYDKYFLI